MQHPISQILIKQINMTVGKGMKSNIWRYRVTLKKRFSMLCILLLTFPCHMGNMTYFKVYSLQLCKMRQGNEKYKISFHIFVTIYSHRRSVAKLHCQDYLLLLHIEFQNTKCFSLNLGDIQDRHHSRWRKWSKAILQHLINCFIITWAFVVKKQVLIHVIYTLLNLLVWQHILFLMVVS